MNEMDMLTEASEKSQTFANKLPFEIYWDFAGTNKELLKETLELVYFAGYFEAMKKYERK
jgi:hypothetical protein